MNASQITALLATAPADSLAHLLFERLRRDPDALAFVDGERSFTVAQFAHLCVQASCWLRARGIEPGDRLALWLVNRVEWLALYFAAAELGAIVVSINTRYRSEEVTQILRQSKARMLVLQPGFRRLDFASILAGIDPGQLPHLETLAVIGTPASQRLLDKDTVTLEFEEATSLYELRKIDADAPSILFTTSGTTKGPKLVVHSQRTISQHARNCAVAVGLDQPAAAMLAMLPLCGVFGLNGTLAAFAGGAPVVLLDSFVEEIAATLIQVHRITHTFGSDEMYRRIIDVVPDAEPFPHARFFGFGAFTSAFDDYAHQCCKRGIPLVGLYGSSEVLACWAAQPMSLAIEQRIQGGGRPVAGERASFRIRDMETRALLGPGQSGEIEILGPSNFLGYYDTPEADVEVMTPDGYFRTGDLGYRREDGTLVYQSRMGDAVRLGGFLVNPTEIEEVLKLYPGVKDAQVVAVELEGQLRPVAFLIAANTELEASAILGYARERMAPFKVPARVWMVSSYPVTQSANGVKTQRNKLREWASERLLDEQSQTTMQDRH